MLHLHHGIGTVGNHAAGVDNGGLPHAQRDGSDFAHWHFANHLQKGGQRFAGSVGVGGANGVAVHGAAAEGGQGVGRSDGNGRYAPQCRLGGNGFGGKNGR